MCPYIISKQQRLRILASNVVYNRVLLVQHCHVEAAAAVSVLSHSQPRVVLQYFLHLTDTV